MIQYFNEMCEWLENESVLHSVTDIWIFRKIFFSIINVNIT